MTLLREQIKKEEMLLQLDKEEVLQLQESLKANNSIRRQQYKTLNPLAHRLSNSPHPSQTGLVNSNQSKDRSTRPSLSNLSGIIEVQTLLHRLKDHLESMENNTASMQNVLKHMQTVSRGFDACVIGRLEAREH